MGEAVKALIGDIQKFSTQDGPGIRSTVFLKGCPIHCAWCHNPELISPEQQMILSPSRCIGCAACVEVCPAGAVTVGETAAGADGGVARADDSDSADIVRPAIDFAKCTACGKCAAACYAKAINPVATLMTTDQVMHKILEDKVFYEESGGGVTLSGGEVLLHDAFAKELIEGCSREGIDVCLDTSGHGDGGKLKALALMPNVSHVLYDIKHMDSERHAALTGTGNELILENLRALAGDARTRDKIWIRMPLIRGVNDDEEEIDAVCGLMEELGLRKVSLLPYHEMGVAKARNTGAKDINAGDAGAGSTGAPFEAPPAERMAEIKARFERAGMDADIAGMS